MYHEAKANSYRSLNKEFSGLLSEILESIVEDGETPGLLEEAEEILNETFVKPGDEIVEESFMQVE